MKPFPAFKQLALGFLVFIASSWPILSLADSHADSYVDSNATISDVSSIDNLMKAYYEVVSGPANTPRDVQRDLSLHHPKAQIFPTMRNATGGTDLLVMSISEFHRWSKPVYDAGFFETETKRDVTSFGNTFHIWSYYETRKTPQGEVTGRGINNIQVYFDGQRYWILSETWDSERPGNPMVNALNVITKP